MFRAAQQFRLLPRNHLGAACRRLRAQRHAGAKTRQARSAFGQPGRAARARGAAAGGHVVAAPGALSAHAVERAETAARHRRRAGQRGAGGRAQDCGAGDRRRPALDGPEHDGNGGHAGRCHRCRAGAAADDFARRCADAMAVPCPLGLPAANGPEPRPQPAPGGGGGGEVRLAAAPARAHRRAHRRCAAVPGRSHAHAAGVERTAWRRLGGAATGHAGRHRDPGNAEGFAGRAARPARARQALRTVRRRVWPAVQA